MHTETPNLFRLHHPGRASALYQMHLSHLSMAGRHSEVVRLCPIIRSYAADSGDSWRTVFFWIEAEAHCELGEWQDALAVVEQGECELVDRGDEMEAGPEAQHRFMMRAPILYFLGRYRDGATDCEWSIGTLMDIGSPSFGLRGFVHSARPPSQYGVALSAFYEQLGLSMETWSGWDRFVDGLHHRLLDIAQLDREAVRSDVRLLETLDTRVRDYARSHDLRPVEQDVIVSGVSRGQADEEARERWARDPTTIRQRAETEALLEKYFGPKASA